jgi:hypothetical protein
VSSSGREGSVWIAEQSEEDFVLTGRFFGHLTDGDRMVETFEDLDAEQAIAWGRARAAVVLIRPGDGDYYSAGSHNPDPQRRPPWPPEGLVLKPRRARGFEALDNSEDDPPVLWDVRIKLELSGIVESGPYHRSVEAEPEPLDLQTPAPGYSQLSAAFMVRTSTRQQADEIAEGVADRALHALADACGDALPQGTFQHGWEVYPHRPGKPLTGQGVSY